MSGRSHRQRWTTINFLELTINMNIQYIRVETNVLQFMF